MPCLPQPAQGPARRPLRPGRAAAMLSLLLLAGCASRGDMVLDMSGSIMYEKPVIAGVEHIVIDQRPRGGPVVVEVTLQGDQGLAASFDITPGIADRVAMAEVAAGRYTARFEVPAGTVGGPFTILGRLRHPDAGEAVTRDPVPVTIPLPELGS